MSDINMKFTWFVVSFPTGKQKGLLIFVYAPFSAFNLEIVNYIILFFTDYSFLAYIFICSLKMQNIMTETFALYEISC